MKNLQTINGIIETFYSVISGKQGEKRDHELFKSLFYPRARLIYFGEDIEGTVRAQYWTPDFYVKRILGKQETELETGFFEEEIHQNVNIFGNIAHVFSTYATFSTDEIDQIPDSRGINSIQLLKHNDRWWIINVYWNGFGETLDNPIPKEYLPK